MLRRRYGRPARGFPPRLGPIPFGGLCEAPHGEFATAETLLLPKECPWPHELIVSRIGPFASGVYRNHHSLTYAGKPAYKSGLKTLEIVSSTAVETAWVPRAKTPELLKPPGGRS